MVWDGLDSDIALELQSIGVESDIEFSDIPLQERTHRPVLVRDNRIMVSRPLTDLSEDEIEGVKWEAVSDILAYEAGLSSPGTFSESDWDEVQQLYDEDFSSKESGYFVPGSEDHQVRANGSLLMRDRGEEMRRYAKQLQSSYEASQRLKFEGIDALFVPETVLDSDDLRYREILGLLNDSATRENSYEKMREKVQDLKESGSLTEEGVEVMDDFVEKIPDIEAGDRIVSNAEEDAKRNVTREFRDLVMGADEKLMAASLLYRTASMEGSRQLTSSTRSIPYNFSRLDYVKNGVVEEAEYLREMVADNYFTTGRDLENAFSEAVREFLE